LNLKDRIIDSWRHFLTNRVAEFIETEDYGSLGNDHIPLNCKGLAAPTSKIPIILRIS